MTDAGWVWRRAAEDASFRDRLWADPEAVCDQLGLTDRDRQRVLTSVAFGRAAGEAARHRWALVMTVGIQHVEAENHDYLPALSNSDLDETADAAIRVLASPDTVPSRFRRPILELLVEELDRRAGLQDAPPMLRERARRLRAVLDSVSG